ncbi:hypothetical protein DMH18_10075 [Streptomyces sp. WAC 06783]|nr:hypothetical protein DMH18_10075 [Streptomyces sp. WAC 06783]
MAAVAVTLSGSELTPLPANATASAPAGSSSAGAAQIRAEQCLLSNVLRKGGPAMKALARSGLSGTPDELHAAADPEYWKKTPLATAYEKDQAWSDGKVAELDGRNRVWDESLNVRQIPPGYTVTGFTWTPRDPSIFQQTGLMGWMSDRFWQKESDFYADLTPAAGKESADAVSKIATSRYSEDRKEDYADWKAWEGMTFMHPMYADDARIFLQNGGFPTSAPAADSMEYRIDVENLKARFASCASADPPDPHQVLDGELATASAEWQSELDGQKAQRDVILAAEAKASSDLAVAAQAMAESLGQSLIASRLTEWQAYYLAVSPEKAGVDYPTKAEFETVKTRISQARARASGRLYAASRAALSAKSQSERAHAAQQEAYAIADRAGQPRGRGLMYAQQAAQIVKASAAATQAAAKATETAVHATRASAADSKTLNALAVTQSHATKAEFRRKAAEEAAAQAKEAADGAAVQAKEAAANATKAKEAQAKAEAAEKTAKEAAADAKAKRATAERERDLAKAEKERAERERANAASAEERAQQQRAKAADALTDARAAGNTASQKKEAALEAERKATRARDGARTAERDRDALSARANALEAHAAAVEGTSAAGEARTAASDARAAANRATTAATEARRAANEATSAAMNAREAATRAEAAASRSQAAADGAKADVAITNAAVKKAHAAAAEAIAASEAAAQNARAAKAYAETARSQAAKAQANAVMARLEATGAAVSAVRTAGFAYATAQAAQAARDSAAQVIKPANDAIELGSPYKETDASAGLAVLTGQAAKTAAEQQRAVAKAKADQAALAAIAAKALAAKAAADAKAAAEAAAAAAESARQAVESADRAGASAAEAAEAAKAAKESEARTVEYDRQATADAEAAQSAATIAGGYATAARESATEAEKDASSARGAADAAEVDAATARGIADKADRDADAAEASAARSRELAKEAEDSATRAERAEDAQRETVRMSDSGPSGASGIVSFTEGLQDTITSDGDCEGSHTGSDVGCEIDVTHHITGKAHFILLTCTLPNTSDAACIGHFTGDYLGSAPIDFTKPGKIHVNGWKLTAEVLKSVATGMVQDYIDCAHGEVSGCAWAAASLAAPAIIKAIGRSVKALRDAIRAGSGIEEALASVRASGINPASLAALERLARAAANCFPAGTPVAVAGGTKKIEDLRVGDRVWAADLRTGKKRLRRITELYRHSADALVSVGTDHGAVRATPGHPFWVTGKGWTPARDLRAGYRLPRQGGGDAKVGAVRVLRGVVPVFTFEVEGDHTYFAGDAQVLVHNSCQLFKNLLAPDLAQELALAERLGITPARPGTAQFDRYIDFEGSGDIVKWAVLEDNSLVIMPKTVAQEELSHPVLSGGAPVRAAGEAQIAGNKEVGYFGTSLNNHSGHFKPSLESLEIGREAFAAAGVQFW